MATVEHGQKWRNARTWFAIGFITYGLVMSAAITLLRHGGLREALGSPGTVAILALALSVASLMNGFGQRNLPVNERTFRNFLVWNGVGLVIVAAAMWSLHSSAGGSALKALNLSATIALWVGLVLFFLAAVGLLHVLAARARPRLLTSEQSEAILERVRALTYSYTAMVAMGLTLVVLSLAGPHGPLSPPAALAAVLVLIVIRATLSFATRPLLDELSKTVAREAGSGAFYLVLIIGGGWSILAHLGFVPALAPLDWLTLLTVAVFVASFIAAGRRGLLNPD
jgi:uncharacterized membrane protein YidH (DUF202 family)